MGGGAAALALALVSLVLLVARRLGGPGAGVPGRIRAALGLAGGGVGGKPAAAAPASEGLPVVLLCATQTGTAERFAQDLSEALGKRYGAKVAPRVQDVEVYDPEQLPREGLALLCVATYGDGEPVDPAVEFHEFLREKAAGDDAEGFLEGLRFGVFALGNREYEQFCAAGKEVDRLLEELGGRRLCARGDGDDGYDLEADFRKWQEGQLWPALEGPGGAFENCRAGAAAAPSQAPAEGGAEEFRVTEHESGAQTADPWGSEARSKGKHDSHRPFYARVLARRELHSEASPRSCVHVELDISGSGMRYESGDHVGVNATNPDTLVDQALELLGCDGKSVVTLSKPATGGKRLPAPPPGRLTVRTLLATFADLQSPPHRQALRAMSTYANDPAEASELLTLAAPGSLGYKNWVAGDQRSLLEVLAHFKSVKPTLGGFFGSLAPVLQPRYYSISSSPALHPDAVHVSCAVVDEPSPTGRRHRGVASTWLSGAVASSSELPVFIRTSTFRLPKDPSTPIVMVGAGTGLAPFRGFLQERAAQQSKGAALGPALLFFGCRRRSEDYIYEEELAESVRQGHLTGLEEAFSREGAEKVYVQHRLRQRAAEIWGLLKGGKGVFYVCGDAKHMAKDVNRALRQVIEKGRGCSTEESEICLQDLIHQKRYLRDVW